MIKLKSLLKEGKVGSIYNMKKQMADGSFEPDNPEVLIRGFGRLPLKHIERKVAKDLAELSKRAQKGGEANFKGLLNLLTNTEMHGGKSVRNSLAVPATVKSERHPV